MSGIIWLASYPKSGNTWFRIFLTNLLRDGDEPADINDLESTRIAGARAVFDDEIGIEAADLSPEETDRLRPRLYEYLATTTKENLFMKVHDAWTMLPDGSPLLSAPATRGAIYFIRNPLDVAISYSHHNGTDIDTSIATMANQDHALCEMAGHLFSQLRQRLLSWSSHVKSWLQAPGVKVHVMRYEDMLERPLETFTRAVAFAGLPHCREQIEKALCFSDFTALQAQEKENGFREKSPCNDLFFRNGRSGQWRERLTPIQIERIRSDHGDVMREFGYL